MAEFVVTNPEGKEFVVNAPEGATQEQALEFAKSQFQSTTGGAATGNPNISRQGTTALKTPSFGEAASKIGGAGLLGGIFGAVGPELMTGIAGAAGAFPATAPLRGPLLFMGNAMRAAGRPAGAVAGAVSGIAGETAGQSVEAAGGGPTSAEVARIVGGGIGPELGNAVAWTARSIGKMPMVADVIAVIKKAAGRDVDLSAEQRAYINDQIAAIRGGQKTDAPLESVGNAMEEAGARDVVRGAAGGVIAGRQAASVGRVAPIPENAATDTGEALRKSIVGKHEAYKGSRASEYKRIEEIRDSLVSGKEKSGSFVNDTPEYKEIIAGIEAQLDNTNIMQRSPDVQRGLQKILNELKNPTEGKPVSFQAIDDVRRKLGDVFKGKPSDGYDAIDDANARELYKKLSNLQKQFAGGESGPQAQLLHEYALGSEKLEPFRSKMGRKATALDLYDESKFATDAAELPKSYFKTQGSIKQLMELTGDKGLVNRAALEHINRKLKDASASDVRDFAGKNAEWLKEVPVAQKLVDSYAGKLEVSERLTKQAATFAEEAAKSNDFLTKSFPKERIVNLVQNGTKEHWAKAGPAIASVPEGKANVLAAVRQTIADKPLGPDDFARRIRPALENSKLADSAALDQIEARLKNIAERKIPETEKLGFYRRFLLQAISGYSASGVARGSVEAAKMVPE